MLSNPKITPDHLAKQALVYVRQSTPKQVSLNLSPFVGDQNGQNT